jgi:hypothetical protein
MKWMGPEAELKASKALNFASRISENDATEHFVCGVFKLTEMHHSLIESEVLSTRAHFAQFEHALQSGRLRHSPQKIDCTIDCGA